MRILTAVALTVLVICVPLAARDDPEAPDAYAEAARRYFELISGGELEAAYQMRSQCRVTLYSASGSGVAYHPRPGYQGWLQESQGWAGLQVDEVIRHATSTPEQFSADAGDAEATLGIRIYGVAYRVGGRRDTRFASVVRGVDGEFRILGIGSGP